MNENSNLYSNLATILYSTNRNRPSIRVRDILKNMYSDKLYDIFHCKYHNIK